MKRPLFAMAFVAFIAIITEAIIVETPPNPKLHPTTFDSQMASEATARYAHNFNSKSLDFYSEL